MDRASIVHQSRDGAPSPRVSRRFVTAAAALAVGIAVMAGILASNRGGAGTSSPTAGGGAGDAGSPQRTLDGMAAPWAPAAPPTPEVSRQVQALVEKTEQLDRTVFAREVESQRYEEYFIRLWDDFRAEKVDKLAVLERAAFQMLTYPTPGARKAHDWDIEVVTCDGPARSAGPAEWRALAASLRQQGYRATELEFHQSRFEHDAGQPARSVVATLVHLVNDAAATRQVLRAKLMIEWADASSEPGSVPEPRAIEATDVTLLERAGPPVFTPVGLREGVAGTGVPVTRGHTAFVLAYDLDGDGLSEILIPGENLLLRTRGGWRFAPELILPGGAAVVLEAAVVADFPGDGPPDLMCVKGDRLDVARGVPGGRFSEAPPEMAADVPVLPQKVSALTAGDIDGDGDVDAWFGQVKRPYDGGQFPTPYYDANDGYPAALLVNDGTGKFTDGTEAAGLAAKRHRRTFVASFVDLDSDRDLDLLVNSDFAGLDIYYNDGKGRFTDVTDQVIDDRHNFGMGHIFADFNLDGRLDMYTIGMSSTTARRLTAMGAGRDEFPEHQEKRPKMGYGNRMFFAAAPDAPNSEAPARFVQPAYRDEVARTGWSWGASAPDFDNDGDPDLYVANGFISGRTCRDYCTNFWRRDIYLGDSKEDPVMDNLFQQQAILGDGSWNGFEHNVLFMNEGGAAFLNVAHLMGAAFEFDSRNVVGDDLDGDGKVDLLVLERKQTGGRVLHILRNEWPTTHPWIGVRLAPGANPAGAEIRVHMAGGRVQIGRVVAGDSFQSQHAAAQHFGLGAGGTVERVEVLWPDGERTLLDGPAVNQWHQVRRDD